MSDHIQLLNSFSALPPSSKYIQRHDEFAKQQVNNYIDLCKRIMNKTTAPKANRKRTESEQKLKQKLKQRAKQQVNKPNSRAVSKKFKLTTF